MHWAFHIRSSGARWRQTWLRAAKEQQRQTMCDNYWKPPYCHYHRWPWCLGIVEKECPLQERCYCSIVPLYLYSWWVLLDGTSQWASCQLGKFPGAHAPGMPGTFFPSPQVSDPDMHHGTCVTHVPWCMPGSLTSGFLWNRWRGKTFPAFPAHTQPAILRIW